MKTLITLLLSIILTVSFAQKKEPVKPVQKEAIKEIPKQDSVIVYLKPQQEDVLMKLNAEINRLKQEQMQLILFLFGENIDDRTITYGSGQLKALKKQ